MKFKRGDKVLVFQCPECPTGTVGIIDDKDGSEPDNPTYLIVDRLSPMIGESTRWVFGKNMQLLDFKRKESIWTRMKNFFRKQKNP
jgi:hypothetical protein